MKKIIASLVLAIIALFSFGCTDKLPEEELPEKEMPYNAVLYSQAKEWVSEDFLKENRVKAYYLNEDYVEGLDDPSNRYVYDETAPLSRTFIITEQNKFDEIFSNYNSTIDFEQKIVILYILSDVYNNRIYYLKNLQIENKILTVYYELEHKEVDDATSLFQRCFMVILNKEEFNKVIFTEKNNN